MSDSPFQAPKGYNPFIFRGLLWRRYVETGLSILSYLKYIAAGLLAKATLDNNNETATIIAVGYGILCFTIGWVWHHWKFVQLETEIGNRFNDFVNEMREMKKTSEEGTRKV